MKNDGVFDLFLPQNENEHYSLNKNDRTKYPRICYDSVYGKPYLQMIADNLKEREEEIKEITYELSITEKNLDIMKAKQEFLIEEQIEAEDEFERLQEENREEAETINNVSELYLQNKTIKEIAQEMGLKEKDVKLCLGIYLSGNF